MDNFLDMNLFFVGVFENVFGLGTGDGITGTLYDLVEHFLLFLFDSEGLYFLFLFAAFHLFLNGTLLGLILNFRFFVHNLQRGSRTEELFHFSLKVQIFVALYRLVVLDPVGVQFDEVAYDLLGRYF
jgi:hypothetical protein